MEFPTSLDNILSNGLSQPTISSLQNFSISVLIPSCNEEKGIEKVIEGFRHAIPSAEIFVYDNNSSDRTVAKAQEMGAIVRHERRQGKGCVVRRMFADIDSDVYILVDGDGTYDHKVARILVEILISHGIDMINCSREPTTANAYRPGHKFGNQLLTAMVQIIFGDQFQDLLSGYRVFSRRFVKSFPVRATGFEIEAELTIHALALEMPTIEIPCYFHNRQEGSESKLHTFSDGFRIVITIANLLRQERPLALFSSVSFILFAVSIILGYPLIETYLESGLVPRVPTAILATGLMLGALLSLACGLILDTVTRGRQEAKRLAYLSIPGILEKFRSS
jgi:hypothetical protein